MRRRIAAMLAWVGHQTTRPFRAAAAAARASVNAAKTHPDIAMTTVGYLGAVICGSIIVGPAAAGLIAFLALLAFGVWI